MGSAARGRQLLAGNFGFAGALVAAPGQSPWDIAGPGFGFAEELHGFAWLDDLAAVASADARKMAQTWLTDWVARYGRGAGPGWTPELVGRRQIHWIAQALFLLNGLDRDKGRAIMDAMGRQAGYLARRWQAAPPGLSRFEAVTGYVQSAAVLEGTGTHLPYALKALAATASASIDRTGGMAARSPEALLEVFALLTWTAAVLEDMGHPNDPALSDLIARIAPVLRSLRHADGGLARFHGGGRGRPGLLDHALRQSGLRAAMTEGPAMGFRRLSGGRVTLIADGAAPPLGPGSEQAHASTLAFEMTSGKAPLIVSSGPGRHLGPDWAQAGRATQMHATLVLAGYSSARTGRRGDLSLADGPQEVEARGERSGAASALSMRHDGWRATHGLSHLRHLALEQDGRLLSGEDGLAAIDAPDRDVLDRLRPHLPQDGIAYSLHFHLHPDVDATLDMGGGAVSMALPGGELWVFRRTGGDAATLALKPSVFVDSRHLHPRATKQIVLSARLTGYGSAVRWALARPTDPPRRRKSRAPMLL